MAAAAKIIHLKLDNKEALYQAYMPFVKQGGLFIRTDKPFALNDEIMAVVTLPEQPQPLAVAAHVIWITPPGAQNNQPAGIGVQISQQDTTHIRQKIETYLAGMLHTDKPTATL